MKDNYSNNKDFYDSSILIDIYNYPNDDGVLRKKVDEIIEIIYPQTKFKKSGTDYIKYKRHLKQIALNLIVSVINSRPIATSRNRNDFTTDTRYKKVQFIHTYLTKTLDTLVHLGYIEQQIGVFSLNYKKTTRFWPNSKFIDLLKDAVLKAPIKDLEGEIIRLRGRKCHKNDKKYIGYKDTDHPSLPQTRKDLELINSVNGTADIRLILKDEVVSGYFLEHIQNYNRSGNQLIIKLHEVSYKITRSVTDNIHERFAIKPSKFNYKYAYHNLHVENNKNKLMYCFNIMPIGSGSDSNGFQADIVSVHDKYECMINKLLKLSRTRKGDNYFFIDNLDVELLDKNFHRNFNEDFDHGGRSYNSLIQQIPSYLRNCITINGNETVELDYSGFHLRLLYGIEGIDYQDDPYERLIDKHLSPEAEINDGRFCLPEQDRFDAIVRSTNIIPNLSLFVPYHGFKYLDERSKYKLAQLILINATDKFDKNGDELDGEDVAIMGIMKALREEGYVGFKKNNVIDIINKFKDIHKPIAKHLYSGIAGVLQNIDSEIMNNVAVHFAQKGIPIILIHDSAIVEKQHEEELRDQMMEQYKKRVGFYPVIK